MLQPVNMPSKRRSILPWRSLGISLIVLVAAGIAVSPWITIRGVPLSIVAKFLFDRPARDAYFDDDKEALHTRLQELNVEDEIKDYYRPQIPNEEQLDQHIHQIFYDVSGYVGKAYVADTRGVLYLRDFTFESWARLAKRAGLIVDSYYGDYGKAYVVGQGGAVARYDAIAPLYPKSWLQQQIKRRRQFGN